MQVYDPLLILSKEILSLLGEGTDKGVKNGGPSWTRTSDRSIMSRAL